MQHIIVNRQCFCQAYRLTNLLCTAAVKKVPLIGSPAHPLRLCRRSVPGITTLASKLEVQHRGSSLEATEPAITLAGVTEVVGLPAPEMPSSIRQKQLCGS